MIGSRLFLLVLMVLFASFKMIKVQASVADIGGVSEVFGYAQINEKKSPLTADLKLFYAVQRSSRDHQWSDGDYLS